MQTFESDSHKNRCLAIFAWFGLVLALGCAARGPSPLAVDGRLDLGRWDFDASGDVALFGDWQICWGQLLEPDEECASAWRPARVPGVWTEETSGSSLSGFGAATYRLQIALPPGEERLSLQVGGPYTAHRLWINGVLRGGLGEVGRTANETKTGVRNRVYDLNPRSGHVDLLVQVANFEFRSGGLRRIWYLGRPNDIQRGIGRANLREGMVFSVGVVVGLAYLLLFALGPSERARGYFGLASLVLGLRAVPASISGFGELMAPWASFELLTRLEYLGTALAIFAGAGYAVTKVPGVAPPRSMKIIQLVALALGAIVAFAPFPVVLATLPLQYALPVLVMSLFIGSYGWAWYRGVPGVRITATAGLVYLGVILHDISRTIQSDFGARVELYPYAMVLWILIEGYELMRRFYQTFARVESLSGELAEANFELQETESAILRFVPFDFLRMLGKHSIRDINAGDRVRSRLSVLQCVFTASGSDLDRPMVERDFDFINRLVTRVEPLIHHRDGFVNEFRNNGFQAFFPGGSSAAVAAAVEIVEAVRRLNTDAGLVAGPDIEAGIGIDTGPVLLGTVGSREHLLRGVIGEAIDTARRIASVAVRGEAQVLISSATRDELAETREFEAHALEDVVVETAEGSIQVYEVRVARKSGDA